ncbi:MAG TPA: ABC transporter permease [Anaerolineaceae bacterium]|nr:ABC transporter permease [Anaerolineaceae bacterium]
MATITDTWQVKTRRLVSGSTLFGPLAVFIIVFILLSLFVPKFLTMRSVTGIINAISLTGTIAIGVALLMIAGEFDLSVGSVMAVGGYLFGTFTISGQPLLGLFLAILVPALLGAINGLILVWSGIPSFIVTLGTKYFYRGMLWILSGGQMLQTIGRPAIYNVFNGRFDLLNNLFSDANFRTSLLWQLLLVVAFQFILTRTTFGNHVFAVGGNQGAALGQGVRVKRVKVISFMIAGALAGFTGVILFSQYYTVRVASGDGLELSAIAAAVVGGVLITGGAGSIWGALIGALTISMLRTGVVLMNIPFIQADNFEAIVGTTIILAVILNNYLRRRT